MSAIKETLGDVPQISCDNVRYGLQMGFQWAGRTRASPVLKRTSQRAELENTVAKGSCPAKGSCSLPHIWAPLNIGGAADESRLSFLSCWQTCTCKHPESTERTVNVRRTRMVIY